MKYTVLRADGFYPDYWEEWQTRFNPEGVGVDTDRQLLVYRRYYNDSQGSFEQAVIILNFSSHRHWAELTFPADGQWVDLLDEYQWTANVQNRCYGLEVPSHWGRIFYKE